MKKQNQGITLVALVVTIILLLILAGITISQLTGSGLFENAKLAEQRSKEAQEKEEGILGDYENKIGEYVDGTRQTTSKKDILWKAGETETREVQLQVNVKDYDFMIIYYKMVNNVGQFVFDTSESAQCIAHYTYNGVYSIANINLDVDNNNVVMTMTGGGADGAWESMSYANLTKIIGIKL